MVHKLFFLEVEIDVPLRFLQSGGVDGVVHVFDGLLDLELLGVKLVLELIDGGFEFGDGLEKAVKLERRN